MLKFLYKFFFTFKWNKKLKLIDRVKVNKIKIKSEKDFEIKTYT